MVAEIKLTRGYVAVVDDEDADLSGLKWHAAENRSGNVYARRWISDGQNAYLHRVILERVIERELLREELVDHIDNNALNNKRENLRTATNKQNVRNSRKHSDNSSGYKGVTRATATGKWHAQITANRVKYHLGDFETKEEAHAAYIEAAKLLHGVYARWED